jgi:zinc/manganese transport system substrate-binding protein
MKPFIASLVILLSAFLRVGILRAEDKLKVVSTLSSYADIAKTIGGDLVEVGYVASPKFDPHFIEPKPSDILKVKKSGLFIHSGLDLEAWRDPLLDAAARGDIRTGGERQLDLSLRIPILEVPTHMLSRAEGDIHVFGNPHYWLDPRNGIIIAEEIAAKLAELDHGHAAVYDSNLDRFRSALGVKIKEWHELLSPYSGTHLVGYHNGWVYLMNFAGFKMEMFLEPKPGIPPTPKQIENVVSYVRSAKVPAIVQAAHNPGDAAESVAKETGVKVLTLSQGVGDMEQAGDYISMFDYNITQLVEALKHE